MTRRRKTARVRRAKAADWEIAFFRSGTGAPGVMWLQGLGPEVRREFLKRLTVMRLHKPGPYALTETLWWHVMKDDLSGIWEIRDQHHGTNYRLFCVLDRNATAHGLSSPAIVVISGASSPKEPRCPQQNIDASERLGTHISRLTPARSSCPWVSSGGSRRCPERISYYLLC